MQTRKTILIPYIGWLQHRNVILEKKSSMKEMSLAFSRGLLKCVSLLKIYPVRKKSLHYCKWCTCLANSLLLVFWLFLLGLHEDPALIPWLFCSEALINMHCWVVYYTEAQEAHRKKKNTTKGMEDCWSSFLQTVIKISAERYQWDSLNWEWHEGY